MQPFRSIFVAAVFLSCSHHHSLCWFHASQSVMTGTNPDHLCLCFIWLLSPSLLTWFSLSQWTRKTGSVYQLWSYTFNTVMNPTFSLKNTWNTSKQKTHTSFDTACKKKNHTIVSRNCLQVFTQGKWPQVWQHCSQTHLATVCQEKHISFTQSSQGHFMNYS